MAVREFVNRNAWIAGGVAGVLVLIAIIAVVRNVWSSSDTVVPATGLAHYSTDDGATWFTDSDKKCPPFQKDGKEAVRAYVYRDASGKEFVSHLERYTPEAQRTIMAIAKLPPEQQSLEDPTSSAGGADGIEVKRPKDKMWLRASDPRAQKILQPQSPSGKTEGLEYVVPR